MVISGRAGEDDVFKALDLGAVDFLAKPTPRAAPELASIQQELIRKVHAIRELRIDKVQERIRTAPPVLAQRGARTRARLPVVRDRLVDGRSGGADADLRCVHRAAAAARSWSPSTCPRASRAASPSASTG